MGWRSLTWALCLIWVGPALAQHPVAGGHRLGCSKPPHRCPSIGCCPDDYVRKPCPLIQPLCYCGAVDDFCRKAAPCISNLRYCGDCDDYCRKPLPCLLCPPLSPYLQCGSCSPCGAPDAGCASPRRFLTAPILHPTRKTGVCP